MLNENDIDQIHRTSLKLLAEVGVVFPCEKALVVFRAHGAKTDGHTVYLSEGQVMEAVELAPNCFTIHARNPVRSVTIGNGEPVFAPGYGAPFIIDPAVGKRLPTMDDYGNLARLAHVLPNQDLSGHLMAQPSDVPAAAAHLHMLQACMIHSDKPFIGSSEGQCGASHTLEMASILFGEELKDKPVLVALVNSLSPLGYSREMLEALMAYAQRRQPIVLAAAAMAGSTAPVTLAGMLAMQNAELLAGITLAQWVSPGTPVVYGSTSTIMDMKSGGLAIGSPELSLMIAAHADITRFYALPSRSGGALTDSHFPDAQAGYESMLGLMTAVNSGLDLIIHAGGILSSFLSFSFEKFVLDDEMCGMVRHFRRGITVDPESLAFDAIARVRPGGNYLTELHTLERCRTEFWQPVLSSREGIASWQEAGRPTVVDRAHLHWQTLVAEHEDPPLDRTTVRQLQAFVDQLAS